MLRKMKTQFSQMFIYKYTREMIRDLAGTTLNLEAEFVRTDLLAETMNGTVSVFFLPLALAVWTGKKNIWSYQPVLNRTTCTLKTFMF